MAFTVTVVNRQSVGAKEALTLEVTADGAEANIAAATTGMKYLDYFHMGVKSAATGFFHVGLNANSSGTASNGAVGLSGCASGDQFYITVYGR